MCAMADVLCAARWVPDEHRSKAMGFCYFLYSGGVVVGLWATPLVAKPLGWQAVYIVYTAIGLAWAVCILPLLPFELHG